MPAAASALASQPDAQPSVAPEAIAGAGSIPVHDAAREGRDRVTQVFTPKAVDEVGPATVLRMLQSVQGAQAVQDLTRATLNALVSANGPLAHEAQAVLDAENTVRDLEGLVRFLKTPALRAAFVKQFEEFLQLEREALMGKLQESEFPTGQIRKFLDWLSKNGREPAVKRAAATVLKDAPPSGQEGGRVKLIELISAHPRLLSVVVERAEKEESQPKPLQIPMATRAQLENHLNRFSDALKSLRGVLRGIAEGSMKGPLITTAVHDRAVKVLLDLGGKERLYSTDLGGILFSLENEPQLCGVLKHVIKR